MGEPIQALPVGDYQESSSLPLDRVFNIFGGGANRNKLNKNRGRPNRKPKPSYGAPKPRPSYGAPKPSSGYGAPKPSSGYGAPKPSSGYGAPKPSYGVPRPGYGAPSVGYNGPGASGGGGGEADFSRAPPLSSYKPPGQSLAQQVGLNNFL